MATNEGGPMNPSDDELLSDMLNPTRLERLEHVLNGRLTGLTAVLEDLHKQQNMTACIRTLEAIGIQDVHIIEGSTPFEPNPKITQGCHKWVDLHRYESAQSAVQTLQKQGYRVLAASLGDNTLPLEQVDFGQKVALCFGNELDGLSPELLDAVDGHFHIPMYGFTQSFNISVALGISMEQAARKRRIAVEDQSDMTSEERRALKSRWIRLARKGSEGILEALARQRSRS